MVFVPRVGILVGGSGEIEDEVACSPSSICDEATERQGFGDRSRFALEFDVLFHVGPILRLGFGALFVPWFEWEWDDGNDDAEVGSQLSPLVVVEGVFGDQVAGLVRGFGGLDLYFPAADADDWRVALDERCEVIESNSDSANCDAPSAPFLGFTAGAGGGVVGQVSEAVALRGDLVVQYYNVAGPGLEANDGDQTTSYASSMSGTRFWLMGGLEF